MTPRLLVLAALSLFLLFAYAVPSAPQRHWKYDPIAPAGYDGALLSHELTLEEQAQQAAKIVVGRVTGMTSRLSGGGIDTDVTLDVEKELKGGTSAKTLTFVNSGGKVGTREVLVGGAPQFVVGERVLVFLNPQNRLIQLHVSKYTLSGASAVQVDGRKTTSQPITTVETRLKPVLGSQTAIPVTPNPPGPAPFTVQAQCPAWTASQFPINYRVNDAGPGTDALSGLGHFEIIYRSLLLWQELPDSGTAFRIAGSSALSGLDHFDGESTVAWANIPALGFDANTIGLNYCTNDGTTRSESDTLLSNNAPYPWDSNPDDDIVAGHLSTRSVAGHEFGHGIDLDHSADTAALMYAAISVGANKVLNADDKAGAANQYPLTGGAPGAPSGLTGNATSSTSTTLNWIAAGGGIKFAYDIERATPNCSATFRSINTVNGTTTTYLDNNYGFGIPAGVGQCYRVKALGPGGDSAYTNTVQVGSGTGGTPSTMLTPAPNSTLAGASQNFTWTAAAGATGYAIYAGSSAGTYNYFSSLFAGTSGTASGLPTTGGTVFVRLWTNFPAGWQFNDYQYTASGGGGGNNGPATMNTPTAGSTLAGASQLFTWTPGNGATGYAIYAGSAAGAYNYFSSLFSGTSGTATGLPTNGGTIFVRLWTNFPAGWQFVDYQYTASGGGGGGGGPATMISPAPNTTLGGASQNFSWTTAAGATGYAIYAGSSAGASNYFASLFGGTSGTATGLPTNGSTVWIRLWTNFNGAWQSIDYQYTASTGGGGGGSATMTTPAPGSVLAGGSQLFNWTTAQGATGYAIYAGSTAGASNYFASLFSGTSGTATGLPTNGSTVWIRLWTNFNGTWQFIDYQYTAANGGGGGGAATMISPAPNSNIGGTVNFTWTTAAGTTGYALYVGTAPGGYNIYGALVSGTSQSVANIPAGTIYVRLWTNFASGWQFVDYVYQ